ncbi:MAG: hypothetical protein ACYC54_15845 [Sedimentisphaerales bacterium]
MKQVFIILIFLLSCIGRLNADYFNPPEWRTSRDYTHQSWDFGNDEGIEPVIPLLPDGEPNCIKPEDANSQLISVEYNVDPSFQYLIPYGLVGWRYDYNSITTSRRAFYGGMGDTVITFKISNTSSITYYWKKKIWVQSIFYARKDNGQPYNIEAARNADFTDTNGISLVDIEITDLNDTNNPDGNLSKWYIMTAVYEISNMPQDEYIKITAYQYPPIPEQHPGGATMFDRIDIDTRYYNKADFDNSGLVDMVDFVFFSEQWLK